MKENTQISPLRFLSLKTKWISNHILWESKVIYKKLKIPIEPNWIHVFSLLHIHKQLGVVQMSELLGIQHPSLNAIVKKLIANGHVNTIKDSEDSRRNLISLTEKGALLYETVNPVWNASEKVLEDLTNGKNQEFLACLDSIIKELTYTSFSSRVLKSIEEEVIENRLLEKI